MSEERKRAIGTILEAGFQMESDAFKALMEISSAGHLDPLVKEVLRVAGTVEPRPASISRDLILKTYSQVGNGGVFRSFSPLIKKPFGKDELVVKERMDTRNAGTISDALSG